MRDEFPVQARRYVKYHEEIVTYSIGYHDNIDGDNKIKIMGHLDEVNRIRSHDDKYDQTRRHY